MKSILAGILPMLVSLQSAHAGLVLDTGKRHVDPLYACHEAMVMRFYEYSGNRWPVNYGGTRAVMPARILVVPVSGGYVVYASSSAPKFYANTTQKGDSFVVPVWDSKVHIERSSTTKDLSEVKLFPGKGPYAELKAAPNFTPAAAAKELEYDIITNYLNNACGQLMNGQANASNDAERDRLNSAMASALKKCQDSGNPAVAAAASAEFMNCGLHTLQSKNSGAVDDEKSSTDQKGAKPAVPPMKAKGRKQIDYR